MVISYRPIQQPDEKTMKHLMRSLIIILLLASAVLGYGVYKQRATYPPPSQQTNPIPQSEDYSRAKTQSSCAQLEPIEGEISCKEAMDISLKQYPGEVFAAGRFDGFETKSGLRNTWRIGINLKKPTSLDGGKEYFNFILVGIDRASGEILFSNKVIK